MPSQLGDGPPLMRKELWGIHDPMLTFFPRKVFPILLVLVVAAVPSARGAEGYQWENISLGLSTTDLSAIAQVPGDTETVLVGAQALYSARTTAVIPGAWCSE